MKDKKEALERRCARADTLPIACGAACGRALVSRGRGAEGMLQGRDCLNISSRYCHCFTTPSGVAVSTAIIIINYHHDIYNIIIVIIMTAIAII